MNPAIIASLFFSGNLRKYALIALCVLVFVLSMPVVAVFAMGRDVTTYLSQQPSAESAEGGARLLHGAGRSGQYLRMG